MDKKKVKKIIKELQKLNTAVNKDYLLIEMKVLNRYLEGIDIKEQ